MLTTFPQRSEFEKTMRRLDDLGLSYEVTSPEPAYARVGVPALKVDAEMEAASYNHDGPTFSYMIEEILNRPGCKPVFEWDTGEELRPSGPPDAPEESS